MADLGYSNIGPFGCNYPLTLSLISAVKEFLIVAFTKRAS
jgi:hypothetical protein